jgi:hypothetical protein
MLRKGAKPMFLFNTGMKFRHSSNSLQILCSRRKTTPPCPNRMLLLQIGIGEKGSATIVFVMHTLA